MSRLIRIQVVLVMGSLCVEMRLFRSSYFKISPQRNTLTEQEISSVKHVHDEYGCASLCGSTKRCRYAVYDDNSKKCSLVRKNAKPNSLHEQKPETASVILEKLRSPHCTSLNKCNSQGHQGNSSTKPASCSDIQLKNSQAPNGFYDITIGNDTWTTRCRMTGIRNCGERAWTMVMRVRRTKNTFIYDSPQWDSKMPYQGIGGGVENKLPGYWLNPFRKLCVSMNFQTGATINMLMKVNISANSLYSLLHMGVRTTLSESTFVIQPWTPKNIRTSCLVRGFNIRGTKQWAMKSRVGVQSQTTNCNSPYIVRGVGIGLHGSDVSCGEIHVNKDLSIKVFPATCGVYVQ